MALTEVRILKSVEVRLDTNTVDVAWSNQIVRDDVEIISETIDRRAYNSEEKVQFETDVLNGVLYTQALGW